MSGRLIVVEGLDGCGKTTASWALATALQGRWLTTPGTELRAVRADFDAAFSHSSSARSLAYGASVIEAGARARQWLAEGHDVVIDRYWLSTLVYAPDDCQAALSALEALLQPADLTLYLWAPLEVRRARLGLRTVTAHDQATLDPAEDRRLDDRYRALAGLPLCGRFVVVSAEDGPDVVAGRLGEAAAVRVGGPVGLFAG